MIHYMQGLEDVVHEWNTRFIDVMSLLPSSAVHPAPITETEGCWPQLLVEENTKMMISSFVICLVSMTLVLASLEMLLAVFCTIRRWYIPHDGLLFWWFLESPWPQRLWDENENWNVPQHVQAKKNQYGESVEERQERIQQSLQQHKWNDQKKITRNCQEADACCSICLVDFEPNDTVVSSSGSTTSPAFCYHVYHRECLYEWLQRQSSCPCCRQELLIKPSKLIKTATNPTAEDHLSNHHLLDDHASWRSDDDDDFSEAGDEFPPLEQLSMSLFLRF